MNRRDWLGLFAGVSLLAPGAAVAQQTSAKRKVGVFSGVSSGQPAAVAAFRQGLAALGWLEGRNLEIDIRWSGSKPGLLPIATAAAELVDLSPRAIFVISSSFVQALQARTHTIPIVFAGVSDPVGNGIVRSLARPGGNVTGFANYDFAMAGKWLQLLTQIAPQVSRVVVVFNPVVAAGVTAGFVQAIRAAAKATHIAVTELPFQRTNELERGTDLGGGSVIGLIVLPGGTGPAGPAPIIGMATRRRLPAIFSTIGNARAGSLIEYSEDQTADGRRAASYVDRILRGAKPGDLPIQQPTTFDLVVNLKTAREIGLTVPESILLQATQVIR